MVLPEVHAITRISNQQISLLANQVIELFSLQLCAMR